MKGASDQAAHAVALGRRFDVPLDRPERLVRDLAGNHALEP
jgi:hypothetical protein